MVDELKMYDDLYYVASAEDEAVFREHLKTLGLFVLPARPEYPSGLSDEEIEMNRNRFLSLKPIEQVQLDTKPFLHYNCVAAPLIEWDVTRFTGKVIVAGFLRHHSYMTKEGEDFAAIGRAFTQIKAWLGANWRSVNKFEYVGPGASRLINVQGYTWSSFDPARTTVENLKVDGTRQELTYDQWVESDSDRNAEEEPD